jgi:hypothetical protein
LLVIALLAVNFLVIKNQGSRRAGVKEAFKKSGFRHEMVSATDVAEVHRFYRVTVVDQTTEPVQLSVSSYVGNLVKVSMQKTE